MRKKWGREGLEGGKRKWVESGMCEAKEGELEGGVEGEGRRE